VKNAFRALLGVILALGAAELYIRPIYTLSATYEPGIGYVNAPGRIHWGLEGLATSTWGAHGERITPGGAGGRPVLVLGDSFTEGVMVDDALVFPAVAQAALDRDGVKLELINAGRSTMAAAEYVAMAARYRELWKPAWTVIELRSDDLAADAWDPTRTHFVREPQGLTTKALVTPRRTGASGKLFALRQATMLLGYGGVRFARFRAAAAAEPPLFQASRQRATEPTTVDAPVEEELDLLFAAYDNHVTVLFLSAALAEEDPIEERVKRHCAHTRASCVFTRTEFLALRTDGRDAYGFFNSHAGIGHLNEHGHAIAGALLARELFRVDAAIDEASP
jgi:hypothetical protein